MWKQSILSKTGLFIIVLKQTVENNTVGEPFILLSSSSSSLPAFLFLEGSPPEKIGEVRGKIQYQMFLEIFSTAVLSWQRGRQPLTLELNPPLAIWVQTLSPADEAVGSQASWAAVRAGRTLPSHYVLTGISNHSLNSSSSLVFHFQCLKFSILQLFDF